MDLDKGIDTNTGPDAKIYASIIREQNTVKLTFYPFCYEKEENKHKCVVYKLLQVGQKIANSVGEERESRRARNGTRRKMAEVPTLRSLVTFFNAAICYLQLTIIINAG